MTRFSRSIWILLAACSTAPVSVPPHSLAAALGDMTRGVLVLRINVGHAPGIPHHFDLVLQAGEDQLASNLR